MASVFFPHWAMESWTRRTGETPPEDRPFALVAEGPHGRIVQAVTPAARQALIYPGKRLADARAICPQLAIDDLDAEWNTRALSSLTGWCGRWSPWTVADGKDGIFIDLTGAIHLMGGDEAAARAIRSDLRRAGHRAQVAIAPTIGAAWGLARYGGARWTCIAEGELHARLAPLPVEALRLDPDTALLLGRLGLKTIGALAAVPRLPLARRFTAADPSLNPLTRLDQALGRLPEPIAPQVVETPPRALRRATEPVTHLPLVEAVLDDMASELVRQLEERGQGLRRARLEAYRVDGGIEAAEVETARPTRDVRHLRRLFDGKLERWDAGFGFDAFALTAVRAESLGAAQPELLGESSGKAEVARLADRLVAKLGIGRVQQPIALESHVPERSIRWVSVLDSAPRFAPRPDKQRPLRMLDRPEAIDVIYATPEGAPRQFTWRRRTHRVAKVEGPERVGPEWWRERSTARARDYYRVEDETGRRYWLYRDGRYGDGRDTTPGWFMHGLFA